MQGVTRVADVSKIAQFVQIAAQNRNFAFDHRQKNAYFETAATRAFIYTTVFYALCAAQT